MQTFLVAMTVVAALTAPTSQASRLLKAQRYFDDVVGDPSGYSAQNSAFSIDPLETKSRVATTPFDAEAAANSDVNDVYRAASDIPRVTFATVEASSSVNPDREKELVQTRVRVATDVVGSKPQDIKSGAPLVPAIFIGGASAAQTYEGATSVTGSNAFMVNQGNKKKTVISNSMLTSSGDSLKAASKAGSYGVTGQPASAMALSGSATGRIQIARADTAVAVAQTEKTSAEEKRWGWTQSGPFRRS